MTKRDTAIDAAIAFLSMCGGEGCIINGIDAGELWFAVGRVLYGPYGAAELPDDEAAAFIADAFPSADYSRKSALSPAPSPATEGG